MTRLFLVAILAGIAFPAFAQMQPPTPSVDPRLAYPMVQAMQAMLALREAEMKALKEDAAKREADWAAYSAPLWKDEAKVGGAK